MPRCVPLDRLPQGLTFPAPLAERIHHDPNAGKLCFEGFMSKSDFDKLIRLHNDAAYQRAVERLFQLCTYNDSVDARPAWLKPLLIAGIASAVIVMGIVGVCVFC